jgi:ATPase subunit of ABC transporter with duplicated ATPase domains
MTASIELEAASIATLGGRLLFDRLELCLKREKVALVGRNGVGKSTLLAALAGQHELHGGRLRTSSPPLLVPQLLDRAAAPNLSDGERRRRLLRGAQASRAEILLLDEPTEGLDDRAVAWLRDWLVGFRGCLLVASHDRRLLLDFRHFFVVSEAGCRYFSGRLEALDEELDREHAAAQQRYVSQLARLAAAEEHDALVELRKARKKRYGRCRELDRATPRIRLNQKRSDAQVSHGRLARLRAERLDAVRQWSKASRRALSVELPLALAAPSLPESSGPILRLDGATARNGGRLLFEGLSLELDRERVAVVGPNGAGKSTLLEAALGRGSLASGSVRSEPARIGCIAQEARDWRRSESLLTLLRFERPTVTADELSRCLVAHRFPLALAERPLESLSPGERTRAALICLFERSPAPELLVLDEPTFSLDLLGQRALTEALRVWPGGLLVASHDRAFLEAIGITQYVDLDRSPRADETDETRAWAPDPSRSVQDH